LEEKFFCPPHRLSYLCGQTAEEVQHRRAENKEVDYPPQQGGEDDIEPELPLPQSHGEVEQYGEAPEADQQVAQGDNEQLPLPGTDDPEQIVDQAEGPAPRQRGQGADEL